MEQVSRFRWSLSSSSLFAHSFTQSAVFSFSHTQTARNENALWHQYWPSHHIRLHMFSMIFSICMRHSDRYLFECMSMWTLIASNRNKYYFSPSRTHMHTLTLMPFGAVVIEQFVCCWRHHYLWLHTFIHSFMFHIFSVCVFFWSVNRLVFYKYNL